MGIPTPVWRFLYWIEAQSSLQDTTDQLVSFKASAYIIYRQVSNGKYKTTSMEDVSTRVLEKLKNI